MKTTLITKSIIAALLLGATSTSLSAQTATATCPLGHEPGYGRSLDAGQKAGLRAEKQQLVAELQQKQAAGTLTAEEQAWLQSAGQRGGSCVAGTPGGRGQGKGPGAGNGQGQRKRQGMRDGSGPRCAEGACPSGNGPQGRGRR
jgi:hypothetical protein